MTKKKCALDHESETSQLRSSSACSGAAGALMAAALALPGLAIPATALGQDRADGTTVAFKFVDYQDYQAGSEDRIKVHTPMLFLRSALTPEVEAEGSFVVDTVGGASPFFYDTLSGASGIDIDDRRQAADLKFTRYFDRFSLGAGGVISDERDYTSRTGIVESQIWSEDRNTTVSLAAGFSNDGISSRIDTNLHEGRRSWKALTGVTQVFSPISIAEFNLTYGGGDGYFDDPYKTLDNRPASRDQFAFLIRHNLYVEAADASLHTDYRFYADSWDVDAHTFEVAWFQPLPWGLMLRPGLRYYSQSRAEFFIREFPPEDLERFTTGDQRLSGFGDLTLSIKLVKEIADNWSFDFRYEYLTAKGEYKLGGDGDDEIKSFYSQAYYFGVTKQFK